VDTLNSVWLPNLSADAAILQVSYSEVQTEKSNNIAHPALDFRRVWSVHAGPTKEPKPWIEPQPILSRKLFLRIFIASFRRPPALPRRLRSAPKSGNVQTAVKMVMDIEDPTHQANRMLSAALLIRNELLDEGLD
jgi:hypothetical protein